MDEQIERAAAALREADALSVCAGAGMGVDSGLPDFRGTEGFWRAYPIIARLGLSFEEMANPAWFERDPHLAWAFYGHRLNLYRRTDPHRGFNYLLEIGSRKAHGCWVFTSNVDGQFQKAGFPPERIVECHGSIHHFQCSEPCGSDVWEAEGGGIRIDEVTFRASEPSPKCRHCSAVARPNVLMFGDPAWLDHRTRAQQQRFMVWVRTLEESGAKFVVIEVGAGTVIPTVRLTSERMAERLRGTLVRINPREATVPNHAIGLPLSASEGVQRRYAAL